MDSTCMNTLYYDSAETMARKTQKCVIEFRRVEKKYSHYDQGKLGLFMSSINNKREEVGISHLCPVTANTNG